jgi:hypothetical protein
MKYRGIAAGIAAAVISVGSSSIGLAREGDGLPGPGQRPPAPCGKICGFEVRYKDFPNPDSVSHVDGSVSCPKGMVAVGGGAWVYGLQFGFEKVATQSSFPLLAAPNVTEGWYASAIEVNGGTEEAWGLSVYVTCVRAENLGN